LVATKGNQIFETINFMSTNGPAEISFVSNVNNRLDHYAKARNAVNSVVSAEMLRFAALLILKTGSLKG
jgi:hypothetical protein